MAQDGADSEPRGDPGQEREESVRNVTRASRSLIRGLVSVALLVALVLGLLLAVPGLHQVADQVSDMQAGWIVAAVGLEVLSCLGYVLAFLQVFDRAPLRFGARVALSELAFGAAVSIGGAGSVAVGGWLLVERGAPAKRVAERSAVLFLLTSAVNVVTLILAGLGLFTGILSGPSNPLLSILPAGVGTLVLAGFLALPRFADSLAQPLREGRLQTFLKETAFTVRETERLFFSADWRLLGAYGFLWFDIAALAACFAAAGHVPPLASIVLAYQIGYLANIIPIPGSLGILDGSLVGMLVIYGVNATRATAAVVVYHAIALWIPALWGTVAFLLLRRSRGEPITLRPPIEERQRLRAERRHRREERRHARAGR